MPDLSMVVPGDHCRRGFCAGSEAGGQPWCHSTHQNPSTLMAQSAPASATTGTIRSASGHFTNFKLVIDQFAEALTHGRDSLVFGGRSDGVETSCDMVIDLSGGTPLFTGWEKRDGYFRVAADDSVPRSLARLLR